MEDWGSFHKFRYGDFIMTSAKREHAPKKFDNNDLQALLNKDDGQT